MTYYRVKVPDKVYRLDGYLQTVGGELFTPTEFRKYSTPDKYGAHLRPEWVDPVQISKRRVYWFFGARFEQGKHAGEVAHA